MSTNYIDQITDTAGTTHDISEGDSTRIFRATCSTAASTAAKVATLDTSNRHFSLTAGVRVAGTFTTGNTAATPTLRVDGSSTGTAKTIAFLTAATSKTTGNGTTYNTWGAYETVIFTYDGTYWINSGSGLGIYNTYKLANSKSAYGYCDTVASTAEKAVTCDNFFTLSTGAVIGIMFSTANTAATPKLNINSTGAKSIFVGMSTPNDTWNVLKWSAQTMIYFLYDGSYFYYITSVSAGDVVSARGANTWYGTSSTSAATQTKTSTIDNFVLTKGSFISITFSTANTYVGGALGLNISSTGLKTIYHNNAATSSTNTLLWDAGDTLTFIYNGTGYYFVGKSKATAVKIVRW